MILLDVAKELKENRGYEEVPLDELIGVLRDGFTAISDMAVTQCEDFVLQIPKFGVFKVKKMEARIGFNPKTKEKINIPEKNGMKFRVSSKLRERLVNTKKAKGKPKPKKK